HPAGSTPSRSTYFALGTLPVAAGRNTARLPGIHAASGYFWRPVPEPVVGRQVSTAGSSHLSSLVSLLDSRVLGTGDCPVRGISRGGRLLVERSDFPFRRFAVNEVHLRFRTWAGKPLISHADSRATAVLDRGITHTVAACVVGPFCRRLGDLRLAGKLKQSIFDSRVHS